MDLVKTMNNLLCKACGKSYPLNAPVWRCECGGLLDIEFEAKFDIKKISARKPTLWRYREAIPVDSDASIVSFDEGFTPLLEMKFAGRTVYVKEDYLFPTGSYKDRGASVLLSRLKENGLKKIVEDSSGNAGAAIAAYAARAGMECDIYVPAGAPAGKGVQIRAYGATLVRVPGSREDTARAVKDAASSAYYASHSWNPFFFQGTKTFAYEVTEQLGWKAPDAVVLPVGNGTLLLGAFIGFNDLLQAGVIDRVPAVIAVQAENCAPLHAAFTRTLAGIPKITTRETIADGIAIAEPIRGSEIITAVRQSHGEFITVNEDEIRQAFRELGTEGIYVEPTSAATIAGLKKYLKTVSSGGVIVSTLTGSGLKETEKIAEILGKR
jgi:threonine synthase